MRLTRAGVEKVFDNTIVYFTNNGEPVFHMTGLAKLQFDQRDFEDSVVLSIEEASQICTAMNPTHSDIKWRNLLEKRIKEATK